MTPATLDRAGIAARIPHQGRMCLLERVQDWSADAIRCTAGNQRDASHPLRSAAGLPAACGIEYAAQAMALHGALNSATGAAPAAGLLASVRGVRMWVSRLDTVPGELVVSAHKRAGDTTLASYDFTLCDEGGALLVEGRATVVLDARR
jgi:predicted hotdog family 3-hydroxylacyl-ACP dehydratase